MWIKLRTFFAIVADKDPPVEKDTLQEEPEADCEEPPVKKFKHQNGDSKGRELISLFN